MNSPGRRRGNTDFPRFSWWRRTTAADIWLLETYDCRRHTTAVDVRLLQTYYWYRNTTAADIRLLQTYNCCRPTTTEDIRLLHIYCCFRQTTAAEIWLLISYDCCRRTTAAKLTTQRSSRLPQNFSVTTSIDFKEAFIIIAASLTHSNYFSGCKAHV